MYLTFVRNCDYIQLLVEHDVKVRNSRRRNIGGRSRKRAGHMHKRWRRKVSLIDVAAYMVRGLAGISKTGKMYDILACHRDSLHILHVVACTLRLQVESQTFRKFGVVKKECTEEQSESNDVNNGDDFAKPSQDTESCAFDEIVDIGPKLSQLPESQPDETLHMTQDGSTDRWGPTVLNNNKEGERGVFERLFELIMPSNGNDTEGDGEKSGLVTDIKAANGWKTLDTMLWRATSTITSDQFDVEHVKRKDSKVEDEVKEEPERVLKQNMERVEDFGM